MESSGGVFPKSLNHVHNKWSLPSGSVYKKETNVTIAAVGDKVTAHLAPAGSVGVAANGTQKKRRSYSFETNPSIRKRQHKRLLNKLRHTIDEFAARVGQQVVVIIAASSETNKSYKVFGTKPLEDVLQNLQSIVMEELESALTNQASTPDPDNSTLFALPPLIINGIPTPVEKMTQAQLRTFIPLMLKYSTGRGKPGWGKESTRPSWWPKELPWANVRMDVRSSDEKLKISWTHALRQIIINCYKFHGREDLLPTFTEEKKKKIHTTGNKMIAQKLQTQASDPQQMIVASSSAISSPTFYSEVKFAPDNLHTLSYASGTESIDSNNTFISMPAEATQRDGSVLSMQTIADVDSQGEVVDLNSITGATLNKDCQFILTNENGYGNPELINGMLSVPVNIQHVNTNNDGTMYFCYKVETSNTSENMNTFISTPDMAHQMIQGVENDPSNGNVKEEEFIISE